MILLHVGQRVARYIWSVHESEKKRLEFRDICIFVTCQMGVHASLREDVNSS